MAIIRQSIPIFAVPDFRNLGTCMKILLITLMFMVGASLLQSPNDRNFAEQFAILSIWVCPSIILSITILYLGGGIIARSRFPSIITLVVVFASFAGVELFVYHIHDEILEHMIAVVILTLFTMHYFALIKKALSPAATEARLAALTARIRPHFLFNSLNAAISLIRTRPTEAEMVLENLAELFRAQLGDHTKSSTLEKEIQLAQDYLAIEQIRMGNERLKTSWKVNAPEDAITPSLLLQPLLENAVYHGIEPLRNAGAIRVVILRVKNWIYITITNPLPDVEPAKKRQGNQMALSNLSERLALMFDQDARLSFKTEQNKYITQIRLPYRSARMEAIKEFSDKREGRLS
ncbi:sensor histidine kinase [Neisseria sp. Ec49-e6-T10]|uniref:sensor histidine kinase n=1 Tax=Neisseria sp. Ec49-e6-T10 TaxID=3140744 RepID=UPI003EBFA6EC